MPVQTRSMIKRANKEQQLKEQRENKFTREEIRREIIISKEQDIEEFQQTEHLVKDKLEQINQKPYLMKEDIEFIRINGFAYYSLFDATYIKLGSLIDSLFHVMTHLNDQKMYHNIANIIIQIYRQTEKYIIIGHFYNKLKNKTIIMLSLNKINELKPTITHHQIITRRDKIQILEEFDRFTNSINRTFHDID